ncbi:MAG: hypothetical protein U9O20_04050 [Patescibacteria group bacterium]|nr:hypothetical protein [Patescibacteria group bacterium]
MSKAKHITPGEQTIFTISAKKGGFAEEVLMAMSEKSPMYNERKFGSWKDGTCLGSVTLPNGEEREVALKIGAEEGLFLRDNREGFSLKHKCTGDLCILPVCQTKKGWRRRSIRNPMTVANNIFATWIIHGEGWIDRKGNEFLWPYGIDKKRKKEYLFDVKDGSGAKLRDVIRKGAVRAAHVGTWTRPTTLVPIACGVPGVLHEFEERATGGNDITVLGDVKISDDGDVWGPYAEFCVGAETHVNGYEVKTPFSLHVAKTKEIFPNCQLSSTFMLGEMGERKMFRVLGRIASKMPERFYRLIDKEGKTYRLKKVSSGIGCYSSDGKSDIEFDIKNEGSSNIIDSFAELSRLEGDHSYVMKRVPRLVLDSHFFIVIFALLNSKNGQSHQISGSEMYRYMIRDDSTSEMHRIRNDALFELIRPEFDVERMELYVYPASSLRLPEINQYNFNQETWNPKHWLGKELRY